MEREKHHGACLQARGKGAVVDEVVRHVVNVCPVVHKFIPIASWIDVADKVETRVVDYDIAVWSAVGGLGHDDGTA